MAGVTFNGQTIVSIDSPTDYRYGVWSLVDNIVGKEMYTRSIPGSSGLLEYFSGFRGRVIRIACTWHSRNIPALESLLESANRDMTYSGLILSTGSGHSLSYNFCRLDDIGAFGNRVVGSINGTPCEVVSRMLTFVQVRN